MTRLLIAVAVIAALGGLFAFGLLRGRPDRIIESNRLGQQVPSFELPVFERHQAEWGPSFALAEHLGERPLVINFWASWCGPCYREAPVLEAFWQAHRDEVLVVGVQTQDRGNQAEGRAFLEQFDLSFPNVNDDRSTVSVDYGLFGVPETFFVRADGTLAYKHAGELTAAVLEEQLEAIR